MFSQQSRVFLKQFCARSAWNSRSYAAQATSTGFTAKDTTSLFSDREMQYALRKLTRVDYKKVFRARKTGARLTAPIYKFMTDEELKKERFKAQAKAEKILQMPPLVRQRTEINEIYSEDPALQGYDTSKYVFTDITYGVPDRKRLIAVRDPTGTLRAATWDERHRINQLYFPLPYREIEVPRMFEDHNLTALLQKGEYEFILDRACIQFEPDDPWYHRIVHKVHAFVNYKGHFDSLRSTRHFGPLVFYLLQTAEIDNLLLDLIKTSHIDEAALLVQLYYKVHPSDDILVNELIASGGLALVECYVHTNATQEHKLKQELIAYKRTLLSKED